MDEADYFRMQEEFQTAFRDNYAPAVSLLLVELPIIRWVTLSETERQELRELARYAGVEFPLGDC